MGKAYAHQQALGSGFGFFGGRGWRRKGARACSDFLKIWMSLLKSLQKMLIGGDLIWWWRYHSFRTWWYDQDKQYHRHFAYRIWQKLDILTFCYCGFNWKESTSNSASCLYYWQTDSRSMGSFVALWLCGFVATHQMVSWNLSQCCILTLICSTY